MALFSNLPTAPATPTAPAAGTLGGTFGAMKTAAAPPAAPAPTPYSGPYTQTNNGVTSFDSNYISSLGPNAGFATPTPGGHANNSFLGSMTGSSIPSWLQGVKLSGGGDNANGNEISSAQVSLPGGQTGYYVPSSWGLNEGTQYLDAATASKYGGTALSTPGQLNGKNDMSANGYLFATDPSQVLRGTTGLAGGNYTPGVAGGQDLKQFATALAAAGSIVGGGLIAPLAAGGLGAGAAGITGATTGAVLGGGIGAAAANANNNAEANPLGTLAGGVTGAALGGTFGGIGGELLGGPNSVTPGANAVSSGANGGLGISEDLGTGSLAPGEVVNAAGNPGYLAQSGNSGMFGGGLSTGGQIADQAATDAATAGLSNASPTSFGGATPSDAQLLNASVPYGGPDPLADTSYLSGLDTSTVAPGADAASGGATGGINAAGAAGSSASTGVLGTVQKILGAGGAAKALAGAGGGSNVAGSGTAGAAPSALGGVVAGAAGLLNPAKGFTYSGPAVPDSNNAAMIQANQQGAQGVMNTFNALNQPNFTMDKSNLDTQLRNQGIYPTPTFDPSKPIGPNNQPGAYEQSMMRLTTSQNQLTAANEGEAGALGLTAASNLFKNQISANQTSFPEAEALWNAKAGATAAQNSNIGSVLGPALSYGLQIPNGQTSGTNFDQWLNSLFS